MENDNILVKTPMSMPNAYRVHLQKILEICQKKDDLTSRTHKLIMNCVEFEHQEMVRLNNDFDEHLLNAVDYTKQFLLTNQLQISMKAITSSGESPPITNDKTANGNDDVSSTSMQLDIRTDATCKNKCEAIDTHLVKNVVPVASANEASFVKKRKMSFVRDDIPSTSTTADGVNFTGCNDSTSMTTNDIKPTSLVSLKLNQRDTAKTVDIHSNSPTVIKVRNHSVGRFTKRIRREKHVREKRKRLQVYCAVCKKTESTSEPWAWQRLHVMDHVQEKTNRAAWQCCICADRKSKYFTTRSLLLHHLSAEHDLTAGFIAKHIHYRSVWKGDVECEYNEMFAIIFPQSLLTDRLASNEFFDVAINEFTCQKCDHVINRTAIVRHTMMHIREKPFKNFFVCLRCNRSFSFKNGSDRQIKSHLELIHNTKNAKEDVDFKVNIEAIHRFEKQCWQNLE